MQRREKDPPASLSGRALFVYYKIAEADRARCLRLVQAHEKSIAERWPQLSLELMQRPASSAGVETWMEIYRADGGLAEPTVQAIEALALESGMPQPRLSEAFVPLRRDVVRAE